jgi:hypothetical protein
VVFGNDFSIRFCQDEQNIECPAGQIEAFARVGNPAVADIQAKGAYGELGLHHSAMIPRIQRGKLRS